MNSSPFVLHILLKDSTPRPCINGATSVHLSRLNASPNSLLGVEVEMQSSVYENLC